MKILNEAGLSHFWTKLKEKFVAKTDIVDNLTSTDTNKALSAKQGKVLNDTKFNISGGKVEGTIEAGGTPSIKNLYDFGATSILGGSNDSKGGEIDLNGCLHPANPGGVTITAKDNDAHESSVSLKADGTFTKDSKKILTEDDIIDNLTSTDTDKALSAKQGKILNDNKLDITGGQVEGTLELGGMPTIKGLYDDRTMSIYGSNNSFKGGKISINGHLTTMKPGSITFMAKDNDDNSSSVSLDADGTFTKDNKKILTEDDIDNNLTSTSTNKALSSYQGKILNESKISHYSTMPEASVDFLGQTVQYTGVNTSTAPFYVHNFFYECKESTVTAGTYEWVQVNIQPDGSPQVDNSTIDFNASSQLEVKDGGITFAKLATQATTDEGKVVSVKSDGTWGLADPAKNSLKQYLTLPTASAAYENKIAQYIGVNTSDYKKGLFYICVSNSGSYSWQEIDVQNIKSYVTVDSFESVTGNTGLIYYLTTAYSTYTVGLYVFNGTDFVLVADISGGIGTIRHDILSNRDISDQHPISAITNLQNTLDQKENISNKVTSISSTSTDTEYPSAKCVYDFANLQMIYDALHPVGEKIIGFDSPTVPTGVTATWTDISATYNGRYFKVDSTKDAGTSESESLPNLKGGVNAELYSYNESPAIRWAGHYGVFKQGGDTGNNRALNNYVTGDVYSQKWLDFDAHSSNSVYQDGAAVKPLTTTIKVYQRTV